MSVDDGESEYSICCYDLSQDKWTTLPQLPVRFFGLSELGGKLVVIGGQKKLDNRGTNEIHSFNERSKKWKPSFPPMPTARWSPGTLTLRSEALFVAGGRCAQSSYTDVVEVFSTETSQWYRTHPLPTPCSSATLVDVGSTCYTLGGYKYLSRLNQAHYVSIGDLFHHAEPVVAAAVGHGSNRSDGYSSGGTHQSAWKMLPNTPTYQPGAGVLAGHLLTLGGKGVSSGGNRKEVCMYLLPNNSWIYFSDLPAPLFGTAVAALSSTEIMAIGGESNEQRMNTVYRGILAFKF